MVLRQSHRILSHFPNIAYNIVAIGASAGGQKPIIQILSALPAHFPAAIIVVQHMNPVYSSRLAQILSRHTALQVEQAKSGEIIRPGTVYTYVPDRHIVVDANGKLSLLESPKMNFVRPSVDKLFMSVGLNYGIRAIAVVLSGFGRDGALGVMAMKKYGGTTIAQDETTSKYFDMPSAAIDTGKVDFVLTPEAITKSLSSLVMMELVS
ncbi:chemotaxis protein CheB [Nostoc sp. CHAB 5715]|uniref:chemotaxis protein CheB n=1 Tax=Nostoc sp. CHAB 5715 TaxID=2780400 RepID=UPI001E3EEFE6|nr:chemotaxis protein CheB [Nostoc sp. CHAB 5715]MCC5622797.1 chemotaxis protein CheB [Nostoc sp. CHAB 5715]